MEVAAPLVAQKEETQTVPVVGTEAVVQAATTAHFVGTVGHIVGNFAHFVRTALAAVGTVAVAVELIVPTEDIAPLSLALTVPIADTMVAPAVVGIAVVVLVVATADMTQPLLAENVDH